MAKRSLLDTSILVRFWWRKMARRKLAEVTPTIARRWGAELAGGQGNAIATPVYIEFVAGARSKHELNLFRAYLTSFAIIDGGRILSEDWVEARRRAERIPRNGAPRQLGDCLIAAIAKRLHYEVWSHDEAFS